MVLTRIEQPNLDPRCFTIPTELVKRESCHPLFKMTGVPAVSNLSSSGFGVGREWHSRAMEHFSDLIRDRPTKARSKTGA
jgi:hypothetical protein